MMQDNTKILNAYNATAIVDFDQCVGNVADTEVSLVNMRGWHTHGTVKMSLLFLKKICIQCLDAKQLVRNLQE